MTRGAKTGLLRRTGGRLAAAFRVARDLFPFTWLGLMTLAGGAVALFYYGWQRIDLLLLIVGAIVLGLGAVVLLVVAITSLTLWLRLRRPADGEPLKLECGYPNRTGFTLPTLWYVPFVRVAWQWVRPAAHVRTMKRAGRVHEEITPTQRGIRDEIVRRFEVSDVFGLSKVAFRSTEKRAVRFVPSAGALRNMHVVRSIAGGQDMAHPEGPPDGERMDMRHYAPGDPIKFVLWKVFARTRQLVVRTPERAISPIRQTVAYMVAGADDEPAAGAARVAIDSGALGTEWVLGADGNPEHAKTSTKALEVLARSADATPDQQGAGLADFLATATPGSVGRAVVFVPARSGPWLERVVAAARARSGQSGSPVEFVVCTDGVDRRPKKSLMARVAFADRDPLPTDDAKPPSTATPAVTADELAKVVETLSNARAKVLLVDRVAGRVYSDGHRRGTGTL